MLREIKIDLEYQPLISGPPVTDLYQRAASGDSVTVNHWRDTWLKNYQIANDHFGSFGDKSYGLLHGVNRHKPAIVIGSGPSLKESIPALKKNREAVNPVMSISCLHNFGYLEDEGCHADWYLSLDAGDVIMDDFKEERKQEESFYWEQTKDKKLLAYVGSPQKLWEKWKGEVYLFNCLMPDVGVRKALGDIQRFTHYISSGGNALGACVYVAKALMGSYAVMYVGADTCFGYDNRFHSYNTKYDDPGKYVRWPDVYGNLRKTWQSYLNFKYWFDHVACSIPGEWINCSEGLLGAYREGNIQQYKYMPLNTALVPYVSADTLSLQEMTGDGKATGNNKPFATADYWSNPKFGEDFTFF